MEQTAHAAAYSQVMSAALVTVRSSGSWVGVLLELWLDVHADRRPARRRRADSAEVRAEHHLDGLPRPATRSICALANDAATVAAACSLPAENITVVVLTVPE